ncbi:MAG TPA: GFA family protein [Noviherbaspirillum sp.]|uniref:GFA family protein n=1 Tax=Noviherbaspirillum sp. TaxID=1926288 RepID=UPI002F952C2A
MINGSCLCGGIRYAYGGTLGAISVCHCSTCRKAQGSASSIAAAVERDTFTWLSGEELIAEHASSPGKMRAFCRRCGSPLYSRRDDTPGVLRLRLGTVETLLDIAPVAHIHTRSLPAWAALDDTLPRYPGRNRSAENANGRGRLPRPWSLRHAWHAPGPG